MEAITIKQKLFIQKLDASYTDETLNIYTKKEASSLIGRLLKEQKGKEQNKKSSISILDQKTLLNEYKLLQEQRWSEGSSMIDYCVKQVSFILDFESGERVVFEKPKITKRFCFGYGMYLNSTDEEANNASEEADNARTNAQYFIDENLKGFDEKIYCVKSNIKRLENFEAWRSDIYMKASSGLSRLNDCRVVFEKAYISEKLDTNFCQIRYTRYPGEDEQYLTLEQLKRLLEALEFERAKFLKRLNTYLEKYGLSKLEVWTYLRD